ncbi:hypothetical protein Baya_5646 [Bagarius yarrelli]|uniref:Uncharacterized protein n=1 Tax=Bagarius yarrelli TaxID=175774 RepID=A0A556TW86_BAGYA|nr:hypothetical protein Baya_5646 [Bagarius yarrelli]
MVQVVTSPISSTLIMSLLFAVAELNGTDALLCDRGSFDYNVYNYCLPLYNEVMASVNYQDLCPWPSTQRYYFHLDNCIKGVVKMTACTAVSAEANLSGSSSHVFFSVPLPEGP